MATGVAEVQSSKMILLWTRNSEQELPEVAGALEKCLWLDWDVASENLFAFMSRVLSSTQKNFRVEYPFWGVLGCEQIAAIRNYAGTILLKSLLCSGSRVSTFCNFARPLSSTGHNFFESTNFLRSLACYNIWTPADTEMPSAMKSTLRTPILRSKRGTPPVVTH